jgi:xanthine/CO dehydrogenase XdhC/CoxF family maturation factor
VPVGIDPGEDEAGEVALAVALVAEIAQRVVTLKL